MKKIYNKQKIKKALEIDIYPRGGGKIDLRTLADTADHVVINDGASDSDSSGANNNADETLPVNIHYIEATDDSDAIENTLALFTENYNVQYYAETSDSQSSSYRCKITDFNGDEIVFEREGQEIKNVLFSYVYESHGDSGEFMDLDYPNKSMDSQIGLHEIAVDYDGNSKFAICRASNKRLIAVLATINNNIGTQQITAGKYSKAGAYGMYVLYDLKVESLYELPPLN